MSGASVRRSPIERFGSLSTDVGAASSRDALFADAGFADRLARALDVCPPDDGILSLDVFDTLLMRDDSSELTRFVEIGERMAELCRGTGRDATGIEAFLARHLGTRASYRAGDRVEGCREGSLNEIHRVAARLLRLEDVWAERFVEAEIAYEAGRVRLNPALLEIVERRRRRGGRLLLLTDMYMHADQVADLLMRSGFEMRPGDALISSADVKMSKASGRIFALAEARLGAPSSAFLHVGDSLLGDYRQPVLHGWRALHLPIPDTEIAARATDHDRTADHLAEAHGLEVEVARPC